MFLERSKMLKSQKVMPGEAGEERAASGEADSSTRATLRDHGPSARAIGQMHTMEGITWRRRDPMRVEEAGAYVAILKFQADLARPTA